MGPAIINPTGHRREVIQRCLMAGVAKIGVCGLPLDDTDYCNLLGPGMQAPLASKARRSRGVPWGVANNSVHTMHVKSPNLRVKEVFAYIVKEVLAYIRTTARGAGIKFNMPL